MRLAGFDPGLPRPPEAGGAKQRGEVFVRLIGVDPGTKVLGWGIVELEGRQLALADYGAIEAPKSARTVPERLAAIADGLAEVLREHEPDRAAVERAFFGKSATSALRVGEARGVALAELARAGVPVEEITPTEVKRAVTGTGGAHKRQVQLMVGAILGCDTPIEPLDASDAVAMAVCLAHRTSAGDARRGRSGRAKRRSARSSAKSRRGHVG